MKILKSMRIDESLIKKVTKDTEKGVHKNRTFTSMVEYIIEKYYQKGKK